MTIEEANKIIAKFMGIKVYMLKGVPHYWDAPESSDLGDFQVIDYESLDALVPVWEKLGIMNPETDFYFYPHVSGFRFGFNGLSDLRINDDWWKVSEGADGKTIQEAACLATAKAIKELE